MKKTTYLRAGCHSRRDDGCNRECLLVACARKSRQGAEEKIHSHIRTVQIPQGTNHYIEECFIVIVEVVSDVNVFHTSSSVGEEIIRDVRGRDVTYCYRGMCNAC